MSIKKQTIGAFVCNALRSEGVNFYGHYNDKLVVGRKHKWVGGMLDISPYDKACIEKRIADRLCDAGYKFRECAFHRVAPRSYVRSSQMFILRTI